MRRLSERKITALYRRLEEEQAAQDVGACYWTQLRPRLPRTNSEYGAGNCGGRPVVNVCSARGSDCHGKGRNSLHPRPECVKPAIMSQNAP